MAKKKKHEKQEGIQGVENALSRTELFIEDNQKVIVRVVTVLIVLVAIFVGFKRFYLKPLEKEAHQQMFVAEKYFEDDSFNLALYGDGNYSGFLDIIDDYGMTKAANLSKYYAGISFLKTGQYEDAIEYLKKFRGNDRMVAPIATGGIGDALVELDRPEDALGYYIKAAGISDNQFTRPLFLMKAGQVCDQLGDYKQAAELYDKINSNYPDFSRRRNVDKYLTRARLMSGK